jgi:hypothetical protein
MLYSNKSFYYTNNLHLPHYVQLESGYKYWLAKIEKSKEENEVFRIILVPVFETVKVRLPEHYLHFSISVKMAEIAAKLQRSESLSSLVNRIP